MRFLCILGALALMTCGAASAATTPVPEVRPFLGAYLATGDQSDILENAVVVGGQVALELTSNLHALGAFAWAPSQDQRFADDNDVNLYQADAGLEAFQTWSIANDWTLRPFLGAGAGVRSFDYRYDDAKAKGYFTGYGALGTEFQIGQFAIRLEGRDYVYSFKGITGNEGSSTRNDIMLAAGVSFHLW